MANVENPIQPTPTYQNAADYEPALEPNFVIDGLLLRGETSMLYGPSNSGKTALLVLAAACVINGLPLFGKATGKGIVVHVGAEAPVSVLKRFHALKSEYLRADTAPFIVRMRPVNLGDDNEVSRFIRDLKEMVAAHGRDVVLVVIDTLVLSIGTLRENDSGEMSLVTRNAQRIAVDLNAHVCLVHHAGKDNATYRGSSAFRSNVDTEIALVPGSEGIVTAVTEKQRNAEKAPSFHFRLQAVPLGHKDGRAYTTVRAVASDAPKPASADKVLKGPGARETAVRTAVKAMVTASPLTEVAIKCSDIVAAIPEDVLENVSPENRARIVARILEDIAKSHPQQLRKDECGWHARALKP